MDATGAINDLLEVIKGLAWVSSVKESEQAPGGEYTVYLLPEGVEVTRNMSNIKNRTYIFKLRVAFSGNRATANNVFTRMQEIEDAIETDRRRDGNAQTSYMGESWDIVDDFSKGYAAFEIQVFVDVHI